MTILTIGGNVSGQLDDCYVIVEVAWIVISVSACHSCSGSKAGCVSGVITSDTSQCDLVTASTATNMY